MVVITESIKKNETNMKLIMLDVDGVLITAQSWFDSSHKYFNEIGKPFHQWTSQNSLSLAVSKTCISNLNRILEKTGAKIVLSSSWRVGQSISQIQELFRRAGVIDPPFDKTEDSWGTNRATDIYNYLDKNHPNMKDLESWIAIDDDHKILHFNKNNTILTTWQDGLTSDLADEAIRKLGEKT